jgi:hypothetical protein
MFVSRLMMEAEETEELKARCELGVERAVRLEEKGVTCGTKSTTEELGRSIDHYCVEKAKQIQKNV